MCGICGTAGFAELRQLEAMNAAIVHRGPDDGGVKVLAGRNGLPLILQLCPYTVKIFKPEIVGWEYLMVFSEIDQSSKNKVSLATHPNDG